MDEKRTKIYRLNEERGPRWDGEKEPRFKVRVKNKNQGWIKKGNQGLQVIERKRTKVYRLGE